MSLPPQAAQAIDNCEVTLSRGTHPGSGILWPISRFRARRTGDHDQDLRGPSCIVAYVVEPACVRAKPISFNGCLNCSAPQQSLDSHFELALASLLSNLSLVRVL